MEGQPITDSSYENALLELKKVKNQIKKDDEIWNVVNARDEVLGRFQPIFSKDHLPMLTEQEFHDFLLFRNNHHWSALQKNVVANCADMDLLRDTLLNLIDETEPIEVRIDHALNTVQGMGKAISTAILLVTFPDKYGVWNRVSEGGLKALDLWPAFERGLSMGERYSRINEILLKLGKDLNTDLWTLDALWWKILKAYDPELGRSSISNEPSPSMAFGIERCLQTFLAANWEKIALGENWKIFGEPGDDEYGVEYPCGAGRIDILAQHKDETQWLVIELKRDQTDDVTVGQVLRYMGWVKSKLAEPEEKVSGLIIARQPEENLQYALSAIENVDFQIYEIDFRLKPVAR